MSIGGGRGPGPWRLILVGTLISAVGGGLTLPFLLVYLHGVRHVPLPVAGVIVAVSALAGLVVGTVGGSLGDRIGVGRMLVIGSVVEAAGTAALAAAGSALTAAPAVALVGAGNALVWPALNALVAAQIPAPDRPRAYALRFGVLNAGLGAGGLLAGFVVSLHHPGTFQAVYLANAATSLAFALIVFAGLRHSAGYRPLPGAAGGEPGGEPEVARAPPPGYRLVLADRRFVAWLVCSAVFVLFGYAQLDGAWAAFATSVVGASPRVVGFGFAVNTAVIVVSQLGVAHLTRRVRRSRLLAGVGACWALAWTVSALADWHTLAGAPADVALVASLGIFGLGETLLSPVSGALPNDLAPEALRSRYNALASTIWAAGGLVGPPVAGVLLAGPVPVLWAVVVAVGCLAAGLGGLRLGHHLPASIDRPSERVAATVAA